MWNESAELSELLGETLTEVKQGDDEIVFVTAKGKSYVMKHSQDCCENVYIESVVGDLQDLVGEPILDARGEANSDTPHGKDYEPESYTWTFYIIGTRKGSVTIRWFGSSNGYYGETAGFYKI